jgi:hypothetical protein
MKKVLFVTTALAIAALAASAIWTAFGRGVVATADGNRAMFRLWAAASDDRSRGNFEWRSVLNNHRIHIVLPEAARVHFHRNAVEMAGPGAINGHRVFVHAKAMDGEHANTNDGVAVACFNANGQMVYAARGAVVEGNVVIMRRE